MWKSISVSSIEVQEREFWGALRVWKNRPHIINRRIMGIDVVCTLMVRELRSDDIWRLLTVHSSANLNVKDIFGSDVKHMCCSESAFWEEGSSSGCLVEVRRLLPKQPKKFEIQTEIAIVDRNEKSLIFISPQCNENLGILTPNFDYRLTLNDSQRIVLEKASCNEDASHYQSVQWLESHVFHKICNWAKQSNTSHSIPSLSIVPVKRYYMIYQRLKEKYWKKLVEMWPECTDPVKYIYEDIAIAAYLLTIFDMERESKKLEKKQSFVDLGCGNGLLVYLMTSEGHSGVGIDVRKRKIWSLYGPEVQLVEEAITPSEKMLFPDYDWLIGNHSDELTPWIPIIAARSSYNMRVFLLPCCPFSFEGRYQRIHAGTSQYQSYLSFIKEVCEKMGFNVQQDKLRIPSTKRLCFVCLSRNYTLLEENKIDCERTEYIKQYIKHKAFDNAANTEEGNCHLDDNKNLCASECCMWTDQFQPRSKNQEVANCSNLDPALLSNFVTKIAMVLLNLETNFINIANMGEEFQWNRGGEITIGELASLLEPELLQQLKHQCGGLQTLLKNHRHVFSVKNGKVSITVPSKEANEAKQMKLSKKQKKRKGPKYKTRPCWFFQNHLQGCPLPDNDCNYIHQEEKN